MKWKRSITILLISSLMVTPAIAGDSSCDNAGLLFNMKLLSFWDSQFPWRMAGFDIGNADGVGSPPDAHTKKICSCGKWYKSYSKGSWVPTRIVDVVRNPECSPSQGIKAKIQLKLLNKTVGNVVRLTVGGHSSIPSKVRKQAKKDQEKKPGNDFRHFHSWPFPKELKKAFRITRCAKRAENHSLETSITNLAWNASGYNPNWAGQSKSRFLMNLYYPEYYLILDPIEGALSTSLSAATNIINGALRPVSCTANTLGNKTLLKADDLAYWLGGCFGSNLPTSGQVAATDTLTSTHTALQRSIFLSARNGGYASKNTVGNKALCGPTSVGLFPNKSHYKFSMAFPYSEASYSGDMDQNSNNLLTSGKKDIGSAISSSITGKVVGKVMDWAGVSKTKGAHRWGASQYAWGATRHAQADGSISVLETLLDSNNNDHDAVYIVWRWVDCCYR